MAHLIDLFKNADVFRKRKTILFCLGSYNHSVIALFGTIFVCEIKQKETLLKILYFCVLNYVI